MKKFIFSLLIIISIVILNKNKIVIPKESIRLRVIANSNSDEDQRIKKDIKKDIENNLVNIIGRAKNIEEARNNINNNIDLIDNVVSNKVNNYKINYGMNYFPMKKYNGITYDDGMYESLVVTLGEGKGDNWWCVLFPPFCLIEAEESNNIEYKFKIIEIIDRYF